MLPIKLGRQARIILIPSIGFIWPVSYAVQLASTSYSLALLPFTFRLYNVGVDPRRGHCRPALCVIQDRRSKQEEKEKKMSNCYLTKDEIRKN